MRIFLLLILITYSLISLCSNKSENDSILNTLKATSKAVRKNVLKNLIIQHKTNTGLCVEIANNALVLADKDNDYETKYDALILLTSYYAQTNSLDSALMFAKEAYSISLITKNERQKAKSIGNMAFIFQKKGDYKQSLAYYINALKIAERKKADTLVMEFSFNLSSLYKQIGDTLNENSYNRKAIKIALAINYKTILPSIYNNMAGDYFNNQQYNEAFSYYTKGLEISEELKDSNLLFINKLGIGNCLLNLLQQQQAKKEFESCINYFKKRPSQVANLIHSIRSLGFAEHNLGNYKLSKELFKSAIHIADSLKIKSIQLFIYNEYSTLLEDIKDYDEALMAYKHHIEINNTEVDLEIKKQMNDLTQKYETEKKELIIKQQKDELTIKEERDKNKNVIILLLLILFLLAICAFVFYRKSIRVRSQLELDKTIQLEKTKQIVAFANGQEEEQKRLARDIHDGLCQQLAMLRLNLSYDDTISNKNHITTIDNLIDEAREMSHNLMPSALVSLGFIPALEGLIKKLNSASTTFELTIDNKFPNLPETKTIHIYRIIQELLQNITKHAQANHAKVSITSEKDILLRVTITDNGIGMKQDGKNNGIGWQNIYSRLAILNGEVSLKSPYLNNEKGTSIDLIIPHKT